MDIGQAMRDADAALTRLIELRNNPSTREEMAGEEIELWRFKSTIEWLLTSIRVEREATKMQAAE